VIRDQNDYLFPSLTSLSRWYENQLIINTSYIKALMMHFGTREIDLSTLQLSSYLQLFVTGLQKPGVSVPHRVRFEVKKSEEESDVPTIEFKQDRTPELSVVGKAIEESFEDSDFEFDDKITEEELDKISILNLPKAQEPKKSKKGKMSIIALGEFYESKLDLMGKISKSIMLKAKCSKLELDWDGSIEKAQETQLHMSYHLKDDKTIDRISLRISQGEGPTSYGFVTEQSSGPTLSLVQ
jgi:hypothetical protein